MPAAPPSVCSQSCVCETDECAEDACSTLHQHRLRQLPALHAVAADSMHVRLATCACNPEVVLHATLDFVLCTILGARRQKRPVRTRSLLGSAHRQAIMAWGLYWRQAGLRGHLHPVKSTLPAGRIVWRIGTQSVSMAFVLLADGGLWVQGALQLGIRRQPGGQHNKVLCGVVLHCGCVAVVPDCSVFTCAASVFEANMAWGCFVVVVTCVVACGWSWRLVLRRPCAAGRV